MECTTRTCVCLLAARAADLTGYFKWKALIPPRHERARVRCHDASRASVYSSLLVPVARNTFVHVPCQHCAPIAMTQRNSTVASPTVSHLSTKFCRSKRPNDMHSTRRGCQGQSNRAIAHEINQRRDHPDCVEDLLRHYI